MGGLLCYTCGPGKPKSYSRPFQCKMMDVKRCMKPAQATSLLAVKGKGEKRTDSDLQSALPSAPGTADLYSSHYTGCVEKLQSDANPRWLEFWDYI